jgi:ParB family chromosome partitioning protein
VNQLEIVYIPVDKIRPSPYQPRLYFDLEELRGSIKQYGIRDPLKVRKVGDYYELIDGERRWRIAQQEGMKTVPCLVLNYLDEEADALSWRFNTERKDYSLEEKAKHFKKHQDEGMSGHAIARIHGYSQQHVNELLAIFRLPEKYQNYLWAGEFEFRKYQHLYEKGLLNGVNALTDVLKLIDESVERRMTQKEFEALVDDYIEELARKQVEAAKKMVVHLEASEDRVEKAKKAIGEPKVTLEKPEDFERVAKLLIEEARKRKSPEQILKEKTEKVKTLLSNGKRNIVSLIEKAKELGVDVKQMEEEVEKIKDVMETDPDKALQECLSLKRQVSDLIKQAEEKKKMEAVERKLREKIEKETVEKMLQTPEFVEAVKTIPTPVVQPVEVEIPKEEVEAAKQRYEELKKEIEEITSRPEVKERGMLFKNWSSHYIIVQGLADAFCPKCGKEKKGVLVWSCCGLPAEEALKLAGDKFEESQRK